MRNEWQEVGRMKIVNEETKSDEELDQGGEETKINEWQGVGQRKA